MRDGGKGDRKRPLSVDLKDFNDKWDAIFGKKTTEWKYNPPTDPYERGFIDGMNKMTESAVHRAVEGMSSKTLTDDEIYEVLWKHFPISDKEANANFIAVVTHCIRVALRKAQEK